MDPHTFTVTQGRLGRMAAGVVRETGEQGEAERPLLERLKAMGWQHIEGARLKEPGERGDHREVLLERRLRAAPCAVTSSHTSWRTCAYPAMDLTTGGCWAGRCRNAVG